MSNEDKMLQLVLADDRLSSIYEFRPEDYITIEDALRAENPIVVTIAKIIKGVGGKLDKGVHKEVYTEVFNYLNSNLL